MYSRRTKVLIALSLLLAFATVVLQDVPQPILWVAAILGIAALVAMIFSAGKDAEDTADPSHR
ncbi:MAG TPA: hypothetical protein VK978_05185 [Candidatus Saccharimonadales bacterium]|nr:hypothetical protein [Candidatus Saccharimonadales bacterium]